MFLFFQLTLLSPLLSFFLLVQLFLDVSPPPITRSQVTSSLTHTPSLAARTPLLDTTYVKSNQNDEEHEEGMTCVQKGKRRLEEGTHGISTKSSLNIMYNVSPVRAPYPQPQEKLRAWTKGNGDSSVEACAGEYIVCFEVN